MMVALALSALLTAAALAASGRLWRADAVGYQVEEGRFLRDRLGRLLETDFEQAERCRCDGNTIQLQSHAALEVKALERDHVPALVTYQIRSIGGRTWLVRSQQVGQAAPFAELVCPDMKGLSMKVAGGAEIKDWKQLPASVTVGVQPSAGEISIWEYTFRVR
jgi:hypothetical protein